MNLCLSLLKLLKLLKAVLFLTLFSTNCCIAARSALALFLTLFPMISSSIFYNQQLYFSLYFLLYFSLYSLRLAALFLAIFLALFLALFPTVSSSISYGR